MKNSIHTFFVFVISILLYSCGNEASRNNDAQNEAEVEVGQPEMTAMEKNGIKISEATGSPAFPDSRLGLEKPGDLTNLKTGKNTFVFNVENYKLGSMTESPMADHTANSHQGQHIHWILNNEPYTAHYESTIEKELQTGKHLLLAFLSRSYHESLKHNTAYVLNQLNVGQSDQVDFNLSDPHLFYSRPKGDYTAEEMQNLLLDFYLVNTDLSQNGMKVKVSIDGTEFILTQWKPYLVQGL
ncbi:MAG: hypothetical protein ACR2GN_03645, partial [Bacteroidia bacterium]